MHLSKRQGLFLRCGRFAVMALLLAFTGAMHSQELLTSTLPERFMEGPEALQRIVLSPDGTAALLLQQGNTLRVVAVASGKTLRIFGPLPGKITALYEITKANA